MFFFFFFFRFLPFGPVTSTGRRRSDRLVMQLHGRRFYFLRARNALQLRAAQTPQPLKRRRFQFFHAGCAAALGLSVDLAPSVIPLDLSSRQTRDKRTTSIKFKSRQI